MLGGFLGRIDQLGRSFRALLLSDTLSILAIMVGHVATAWWIARQGGGGDLALYAGAIAVGAMIWLPLLSPIGDRYRKQTIITWSLGGQTLVAAALAALAQVGTYHLPLIILIDLVGAATSALFAPASINIAAELLPAEQLTNGLGLQKSGQALGRLIGPALGGGILALAGTATTLWLYALLLGLATILASRIPRLQGARTATATTGWLDDIRAGLAAKWHIRVERWWTFITLLFAIFLFPCLGMLMPLKILSLHLSSTWLGLCEAALSAGLLVGALGLSTGLAQRLGRFAAYTSCVVGMGLCFITIGAVHQPLVLLATLVVCGLCVATTQLVGQTHRMLAIPPAFRARMTSVQIMVMQVAATIGPALGGIAFDRLGVDRVYILFGGAILLTGAGYVLAPGYRAFISLSHERVEGYYARTYPALFEPRQSD